MMNSKGTSVFNGNDSRKITKVAGGLSHNYRDGSPNATVRMRAVCTLLSLGHSGQRTRSSIGPPEPTRHVCNALTRLEVEFVARRGFRADLAKNRVRRLAPFSASIM